MDKKRPVRVADGVVRVDVADAAIAVYQIGFSVVIVVRFTNECEANILALRSDVSADEPIVAVTHEATTN